MTLIGEKKEKKGKQSGTSNVKVFAAWIPLKIVAWKQLSLLLLCKFPIVVVWYHESFLAFLIFMIFIFLVFFPPFLEYLISVIPFIIVQSHAL